MPSAIMRGGRAARLRGILVSSADLKPMLRVMQRRSLRALNKFR